MSQFTVSRPEQIIDGLRWLAENDHHEVGTHWGRGRSKATGMFEYGEETHIFYKGHGHTLFVTMAMRSRFTRLVEPNTRQFDTRMFRPTKWGRHLLREAGFIPYYR